jgi:membrane protease YdiL (CAAX protease family)
MNDAAAARAQALPSRLVSALEVLVGAFVVIGHNVFRVVPNEVPILTVLGLLSFRLRNGGWAAMGFRRPPSWALAVGFAVAAAATRIFGGELVDLFTSRYWPPAKAPALAESIPGNLGNALLTLLLVWSFAAFGEEISYRGYLLNRGADVLGGSTTAQWAAAVFVAVLFGLGHWYKGPAGVIDSGFSGLVLGGAYLLSRRNLWVPILAHGFIDTVGVVALYFGWAT